MHRVVKLEQKGNRKQIFFEEGLSFLLYQGEIKKFNITEGCYIDENLYDTIMEILYKRARERALYILDKSYKTEKQIRDMLKKGNYPEQIIQMVVEYLKEYQLINDYQFASMYIEYKSSSKSKKQMIYDLKLKGISKQIIDSAFDESDYCEEIALNKIIEKKIGKYDLENVKDLQKLYRYLLGKGYRYDTIKDALAKFGI